MHSGAAECIRGRALSSRPVEAAGSVERRAPNSVPATWTIRLAGAIAVSAVPLLIVSQWLSLRWSIPGRLVFNATFGLAAVVLVVIGWRRVAVWLRAVGFLTAGVLVVSWLINAVEPGTVIRGALPYAVPVVALAAGYASTLTSESVARAATAHLVSASVLMGAALLQIVFGEAAYRWLAQDLAYPRWWERGRATGLVVNPGRLAQLGLVISAVAPFHRRALATATLGAVAAALSGGRTVLVGVVALAAAGVMLWRTPGRRVLIGGAAAGLAALMVLLALSEPTRTDFLARSDATFDDLTGGDDIIDDARIASITAGIQAFRASPAFGWGPGRFGSTTAWDTDSELHDRFGLPDLRSEDLAASLAQAGDVREIDIGDAQLDLGLLQTLTETGLGGTAALTALLAGAALDSWRRRRAGALALVSLLGAFSLVGPGIVDPSLALVSLWWTGVLINR